MPPPTPLLLALRSRLASLGDPERALGAQAYMKSAKPFHGVGAVPLLHACIEPSLDSKELFLRKAIGWALRQHARTDPDGVRRYVAESAGRLSGLSRREALKRLG